MNQTFKIDTGGVSPLQVFAGDGSLLFDARYATARIYLHGWNTVPSRSIPIDFYQDGTNGYFAVPYGKTFSAPPYFIAMYAAPSETFPVARSLFAWLDATNLSAFDNNSQSVFGGSFTDQLVIGNYSKASSYKAGYVVLENLVSGS